MPSFVRTAGLALAFVATAMPASAPTWIYEADVPRAPVYEPRSYYEPRPYEPPTYESGAYRRAAAAAPFALTPAQRTTIYRTIIPQGRGRGPIVRERIVTEPVAPAPVVRERVAPPALPMPTLSAPESRMLTRSRQCRRRSSPPCRRRGMFVTCVAT